ncbi:glycosyltransferase family 9 protein [Cetobacterium somerae]|uniref:glycosyltransferase family 9 protein n=1 Tax=Cetobacterium somerae TaxID=188913 RepID=UPI00248D5225|nr:glycosyltransferase family 9 protein [Cetobacterium somerae]
MKYKILKGIREIQKRKPEFLKSSYLKSKIADIFFESWLERYKKSFILQKSSRILIISMEALGDNVVKTTSIKKISEYYGKENIYIMCRDKWECVFNQLGYNVVGMQKIKNPIKNVRYKIEFFKKLNELHFQKVILLDHLSDGKILKNLISNEKIGISNEENKYMTKEIRMPEDKWYVLDRQSLIVNELLKQSFTKEDLRPDMREMFKERKYSDIISIGIGASSEQKTLPIKNMSEILKMLSERYPNKKIVLLGNGKKQEYYSKQLIENCNCKNIESYIGRISLIETIRVINDSDFFLGYDSGLSNIAFALRKKYVCLFWTDMTVWQHPFDDLKIIKGDGVNPENDGYHGTDILNSIKVEQVEEALKELKL